MNKVNLFVGWALPAIVSHLGYSLLAGNAHLMFNRAYLLKTSQDLQGLAH